MSALPPVFVEFIGLTGAFKTAVKEVERDITKVEKTGGGAFAQMGKGASTGMTLVAGAAALATVKAVGMATTFQSQMTLLVTACGEATNKLKGLESGAMDIARSTGMGTDQIAAGLYIVEKAGHRGADALAITKAAAQGATAEGVDMTTMTTALTSVMATFGSKMKDPVKAMNELVAAGGMSKTTMQEFASSLSTVMPLAFAAHMSFEQVAAAIATMTQHGTSAQQATQDLANTIRNLQNPNQVAMKAMQQMGVNVVDVTKHLGQRGLTGTLKVFEDALAKHSKGGLVFVSAMKQNQAAAQDLQTALKNMPKPLADLSQKFLDGTVSMKQYRTDIRNMGVDGYNQGAQFLALTAKARGFNDLIKSGSPEIRTNAAALAQMMGGSTALNTALMLTGNSATGFSQRVKDLGVAGGKTGKDISTWAVTSQTLKVKLNQMKQTVETLMISIGMKLIPVVKKIVDWLMQHKSIVEKVIVGIIALSAAFVALRVIMFATNVIMTVLKLAVTGIRLAMIAYKLVVLGVKLAMESQWLATVKNTAAMLAQKVAQVALSVASKALAAAQWLLNAAMDANPITLIIIAIVALAVAFYEAYKHCKIVRDIVKDVGKAFVWVWHEVLEPVVDFFKKHWKAALEIAVLVVMPFLAIPLLVIKNWHKIVEFFTGLGRTILNALKDAGKWLLKVGGDILHGMLTGLTDAVKFIWKWFVQFPIDLIKKLGKAELWLVQKGWDILTGLFNGIVKGAEAVWKWWLDLNTMILRKIGNVLKWLWQKGVDLLSGLLKGITHGAVAIWNWLSKLPGAVLNAIGDIANCLYDIGTKIFDGLWNGMKDAWHSVTGWLSNLNPMNWFNDINMAKGHAATNLYGTGKAVIAGLHNGMKHEWGNVATWLSQINPSAVVGSGGRAMGAHIGALGGGAMGGPTYVLQMTVQGSVTAENDLLAKIEQGFIRRGARRGGTRTYQPFVRG